MLSSLSFAAFLLLASSGARRAGGPCLCSALGPAGLLVNCSSLDLAAAPRLPPNAAELHLRDNQLTSVPPGLLDRLVGLREVSLSGNPFHCDCGIQYLRNWLLKNRAVVQEEPVCASPSAVARRPIADLGDDFFSSCGSAKCAGGTFDAAVAVMLCGLVVLLAWSLRLARRSTFTLYIGQRHAGLEAEPWRSLRPRHRRRPHAGLSDHSDDSDSAAAAVLPEDPDRPLLNMDLLPQVLDVLHKKHNIKIKAT